MKNFLNAFVPGFLKRLDRKFLLSNPFVWMTKLHFIAFYGTAGFLLMAGVLFSFPVSEGSLPNFKATVISVVILTLIPIGFWFYHQINFSIEKQYGKKKPFAGLHKMMVYLLVGVIAVMMPLSAALILEHRTAESIDNEQFAEDVADLDLTSAFVISDPISLRMASLEGAQIVASHNSYESSENGAEGVRYNFKDFGDQYNFKPLGLTVHDQDFLRAHYLRDRQSVNKVRENVRLFLEIAERYRVLRSTVNEELIVKEFIRAQAGEDISFYRNSALTSVKNDLRRRINHIGECKQYDLVLPNNHALDILSMLFALSFGISLLGFTFTSVSGRTFTISVIAFILTGILSGGAAVFAGEVLQVSDPENLLFLIVLSVYGFSLWRSFRAYRKKDFKLLNRVCLVIANIATPFLFIWLTGFTEVFTNAYIEEETYMAMLNIGILGYLFVFFAAFRKVFILMGSEPRLK